MKISKILLVLIVCYFYCYQDKIGHINSLLTVLLVGKMLKIFNNDCID